ncbi:F0F1 ATP synthase subunit gamma [Rheinheimera sp. UJ63]|uniref:F0F1 ATP synthase subunit gamma n=1 Tax=Rheinheimera sp. UJ63 TaxID=2910157 RepID=UPI001F3FC9D0|nr:F0F1 ATP synthase subunit gamma [Rheinheimera sp. UJ63]MCF4008696.1 F0F1 ATP synthase subunit gamma [Rheinheimera sp. UJ63]
MAESIPVIQRKIDSATDLKSVVRTMKAMAAANISQYEQAVLALDDYYMTLELALTATLKQQTTQQHRYQRQKTPQFIGVIVLGSDQGLVGQFNDQLAEFTNSALAKINGKKRIWAVGERIRPLLTGDSLQFGQTFALPDSIHAISPFISAMLSEIQTLQETGALEHVYLFNNTPIANARYRCQMQPLLPLDKQWQQQLATKPWPGRCLPQLLNDPSLTVAKLQSEFLFISLFRACAHSLASENASRLLGMQRAEKNIDELQTELKQHFHHLRQSGIDNELFDLIGGFEALHTERN